MLKIDSPARANQQNIELALTINHDMWNSKSRLNNSAAFRLAIKEFLKQHIFICSQPLSQNSGNLPENLISRFSSLDIQDPAISYQLVKPVFDYIVPLYQDIAKFIFQRNGLKVLCRDPFHYMHHCRSPADPSGHVKPVPRCAEREK